MLLQRQPSRSDMGSDPTSPTEIDGWRDQLPAQPVPSRPPTVASVHSRRSSFIGDVHDHSSFYFFPSAKSVIKLWLGQAISFIISAFGLAIVVSWASFLRIWRGLPYLFIRKEKKVHTWDKPEQWKNEKVVKDVQYYARAIGFDIIDETVQTQDDYLLRMHRVVCPSHKPRPDGRGGYPVLILHGLFQSSGSFITSEERSLAFWLAEHGGYQVFLGNTRGNFGMGHKRLSREDPRFWDWTINELATFDLPAMVEWVCKTTGYDKIAFIGHSQGNGTAFITLSLGARPDIGEKLSVFIALAPAVFAGPLTHGFPFTGLGKMEWKTWKRFFGVLDFIPLMRYSYDYVPALIFGTMGYTMFSFLFDWTDRNWLKRRKTKMFRFTPTVVSSASIFWWTGKGGFASRKCTMDPELSQWWDDRFPPLSVFYGGRDYLVLAEPLLERLEKVEKDVKVIRFQRIEESEHCDFYWAADAVEWCFHSIVEDIEKTRPQSPEEAVLKLPKPKTSPIVSEVPTTDTLVDLGNP